MADQSPHAGQPAGWDRKERVTGTPPTTPLEPRPGVALPQANTYEEIVEAHRTRYLAKLERLQRKAEDEAEDHDYYAEELRDAESDYLLGRFALLAGRDIGRIADALEERRGL